MSWEGNAESLLFSGNVMGVTTRVCFPKNLSVFNTDLTKEPTGLGVGTLRDTEGHPGTPRDTQGHSGTTGMAPEFPRAPRRQQHLPQKG